MMLRVQYILHPGITIEILIKLIIHLVRKDTDVNDDVRDYPTFHLDIN
jgi:hypothetical protein